MSENNNIDDLFKKGLGNFQEEPSENLWLKVEKGLWLKKMLKSGLYIFIGVAVITATALIFMMTKNDKQITPISSASSQQSTITQNSKTINTKDEKNTENPALKTLNTDKSVNQVLSETPTVLNNSTSTHNSSAAETPSQVKTKKIDTSEIEDSKSSVNNKETQKDKIPEKEGTKKTSPQTFLAQNQPLTEKQKEDLISRIKGDEQKIAQNIEKEILPDKTEVNQSFVNENNKLKAGEVVNTQAEVVETPLASGTELKSDDIKSLDSLPAEQKSQIPPAIKSKSSLLPTYEVLFYVMPSYARKTLSGITQEEIDFRSKNEKAQLYLNYGLEFRVRIKNFSVQSGIIQSQAGEKNNYNYQYLKNIDTSGSYYDMHIFTNIDPQDTTNTIISFDSTWVNMSDSTFADMALNNMNQIKYIEIPLNIGYIFNINNHQIGISGGISCAILSQASFSILDKATNTITSYTKDSNYLKKSLWSYNLMLSYSYALSGNTSLFIQSGYKKNINSVFSNSSTQQKYHFIDTKIGVVFKL